MKVEKDVPMPDKIPSKYPFKNMEVGDSFYAEGMKTSQLSNASAYWAKKKGYKFEARAEQGGTRVWRTA